MWDLNEFEVEFGEGEHSISFRTDLAEGFHMQELMLIVEKLSDDPDAECEASLPDESLEQVSTYARVKVFAGRLVEDARNITLRLWSKGRERFRIIWVRLLKKLGDGPGGLNCKMCKLLVEALIIAALAVAGSPFVAGAVVKLTAAQAATVQAALTAGPLADLLKLVDWKTLWFAIQQFLSLLDKLFEFKDATFARICRELGYCPQNAAGDFASIQQGATTGVQGATMA
ncbi:MAG TPA: hypothetical protein VFP12_07790 [Allosphingosinicella sp.]|nr:hypothetical protein [Allosphingosinicella sp.]